MSCDGNRARFVAATATDPAVCQAFGDDPARAQTIMETIYDTASQRQDVSPVLADALTRVLFNQMHAQGITPPTHAADGMPKPAARQGYAVLAQTLLAARGGRALPALAAQIAARTPQPPAPSPAAAPVAAPELATWRASPRSGVATRAKDPDAVTVNVDGATYYVSGGAFTAMKDAVKAHARRYGWGARRAYDGATKTWTLPGTFNEAQRMLGGRGYRLTDAKPTTATPAPPEATGIPVPTTPSASTGPHGTTFHMSPCAPAGDIPPAVQTIIASRLNHLKAYGSPQLILAAIANNNPESVAETLIPLGMSYLNALAWDVARAVPTGTHNDVPVVYWSRVHQVMETDSSRMAVAHAVLTALDTDRCPTCGQWMGDATHECPSPAFGADGYNGCGLDRYGISRTGTYADGTPASQRTTLMDAAREVHSLPDPINNAEMADLWGRIASGVAGHHCEIVLREGEGFATNMQGTIYADPYPLGHDADPRHTLLVTKAGIYHEIGHELTTPPEDWAYLLEVARGTQDIPGIHTGRAHITKLYNIIEDGRMERDMSRRFAGVAETLEAQCAIYPRWGERVGAGVPLGEEVVWPLLYTALPYFHVRDAVRDAMTPEGRALFEELEPIALRGAQGTPEDSLAATIEIARRLEAAGVLDIPETSATAPPPPSADTQPRSGPPSSSEPESGGDAGAEAGGDAGAEAGGDAGAEAGGDAGAEAGGDAGAEAGGDAGAEAGGDAGAKAGGDAGAKAGGDAGAKAGGASEEKGQPNSGAKDPHAPQREQDVTPQAGDAAATRVDAPLTSARLADILNDLEAQAVGTMERAVTEQARNPDTFGKSLHTPLTGNTAAIRGGPASTLPGTRQRYYTTNGTVESVVTATPMETDTRRVAALDRRRPQQQEIAGRLARRLDSIRQETITRVRMQTEGRIDRRRFPAALAGRNDIRTRTGVTSETGMAVSILLDQSYSMNDHIRENKVYDATCIIGQALEQLDVPYEVRGHGGSSTQYKAFDDATLDPRRAARLTADDTGSNAVTAPVVGLATTALRATPDANKLIVNVMDGDMDDHQETVAQYQATRRAGIVTFGVFLGKPQEMQQERMTELFGVNNWRPIASLTELPDVVGQRIGAIFDRLGED